MCSVYFDILILKLMGYSTALLSTPKGRIIDYREWGKFCNFVVVCLGVGGGGMVNMLAGWEVCFRWTGGLEKTMHMFKKMSGSCSKREFSSDYQQPFVNEKAPSCMWQSSWLRCWIAPLIWQLAVNHLLQIKLVWPLIKLFYLWVLLAKILSQILVLYFNSFWSKSFA